MKTKITYRTIILIIISFVIGAIFGVLYWEYLRSIDVYDTGISDEEYIRIAKQTLEAQKFLEKYPNATAMVDRSGKLSVDFRVDKNEYDASGNVVNYYYLRLRVYINPRNNRLTGEKFIDCFGKQEQKYVWNDLLGYLQTEKCLE